MSTTMHPSSNDGALATTHRARVVAWCEQANATIAVRRAQGFTTEEAVRAAAGPLWAAGRAEVLARTADENRALSAGNAAASSAAALEASTRLAFATIASREVHRRRVRGGYIEWQVIATNGRVIRTLRSRAVSELLARGLVRVTTSADAPTPPDRVVPMGVVADLASAYC
jgi:hypothetical protein